MPTSCAHYYINTKCVGIHQLWIYRDKGYITTYNGYVSYSVYYQLDESIPYYSLRLSIYQDCYSSKTYHFDSHKKDFSDLKYITCNKLSR
jgi:hypothetical protein